MIIFNFHAIAVGILIAVVVGPIYWLMPDEFANSPLGLIILAGISTLVTGIAEAGGLKGRLFFLPMWLLGILGTIAYTFMQFRWFGVGILFGILVLVIALLMLLAYIMEKVEWKEAYGNFQELKKMKNTEDKAFWEQVEKSKFFPSMINYTNLMCEHNLEVLVYLQFVGIEWKENEALLPVFEKSSGHGSEIDIDSELTDAFDMRLADLLEGFEEKG